MVCRHITIYCTFFNNNSPPPCQFLCNKMLLTIATVRGMLIQQILELGEPGPPGRICTPIPVCFYDKTIISQENIRLNCYLLLKYCTRQCTLLPPTWFGPRPQYIYGLAPPNQKPWLRLSRVHCVNTKK